MVANTFTSVLLMVAFHAVSVFSQAPPAPVLQVPLPPGTTPSAGQTIPQQVMAKTRKLRWDFDQMMANGGLIDNQKLIGEVSTLIASIQASLQTVPSQVLPQITSSIATIQGKVQQMTAAGKFDAGVLHDLNLIAEIVDVALSTAPITSG